MFQQNLLNNSVITRVLNSQAAGVSELKSTVLDMQDLDSVAFLLFLNTVVDGCVLTLTAQGNTVNSSVGGTALATAGPFTAAGSSNTVMVVEVVRCVKRFVFADLTRVTQNATVDGIIAIQYRGRVCPTVQPASLIASALAAGV